MQDRPARTPLPEATAQQKKMPAMTPTHPAFKNLIHWTPLHPREAADAEAPDIASRKWPPKQQLAPAAERYPPLGPAKMPILGNARLPTPPPLPPTEEEDTPTPEEDVPKAEEDAQLLIP